MIKSFHKPLTILLLLTLVMSVLTLSGCQSALINNGMHRTECELYVNALLEGDFEAAQAVAPAIPEQEHRPYFDLFCRSFEGATSFELTQTGWNVNTTNGVATKTAAYQIDLDNGSVCQITLQTTEGVEGIAFINFNDSTEFIESTKDIGNTSIVLLIISLLLMAFPVWMLVDCIKRKIAKKALWIIVILLSLGLSFTVGENSFQQSFGLTIFLDLSSLEIVVPNETVVLTVVLPIGALIYLFRRKKLSAKYAERMAAEAAAATPIIDPIHIESFNAPMTSAPQVPADDSSVSVNETAPAAEANEQESDTK